MKPADKAAIFIVPASILLLLGVFARILGFSAAAGLVLFLAALVLMLIGYRETIKPRQIGNKKSQVSNSEHPILPAGVLRPQGAGNPNGPSDK